MQDQESDQPLRLLIVDDSEDDVFFIIHALKKAKVNFTYTHIEMPDELKRELKDHDWDVVITDHHMIGYSSDEAVQIIHQHNPGMPVVIVSGEMPEDKGISAMHRGVKDFVMKDNLSRLVPVLLREHKQHAIQRVHDQTAEQYRFLKIHDNLTRLVNRNEFEKRLSAAIEDVSLNRRNHVMMFLDLDQFKIVNDTCGQLAGDELLVRITEVLQDNIRDRDTVARLGGDEFGILLIDCDKTEAIETAQHIKKSVKESRFVWEGRSFEITVSIGVVEINEHAQDSNEVLSCADIACYAAKDRGRDMVVWFSQDDLEYNQRRSEMEWAPRIKKAAEEDSFILHSQTMAGLQANKTEHMEFLVRMQGEDRVIYPGDFIPAAERYNLMPVIDRWVVKHVFKYLDKSGRGVADEGTYFVNLSGSTLSDISFFDDIKAWRLKYNIKPERVCFEITETAAIGNLIDAVEFIEEIRELGFKFALDDFGVGLSSYSYLKTIPVDYLKIDGSFVKNMRENKIDKEIVAACNAVAHAAELTTIAEFVEDKETYDLLQEMGIDYGQGFGIAKPGPLV